MPSASTPPQRVHEGFSLRQAGLVAGSLLVLAGLIVLWLARSTLARGVYVSEMGAAGMPTSTAFSAALLLVAGGGLLIARGSRGVRSRIRFLALWLPSSTLVFASGCFAFASQVTCTPGCPLPVGPTFSWQDLLHTSAAVLGFAAACVAMLQIASAEGRPQVARLSLVCGVLVAVIAGAGALCSLLRVLLWIGGTLEFVATSIAILWLAAYGLTLVWSIRSAGARSGRAILEGSSASDRADAADLRRVPALGPARRREEP